MRTLHVAALPFPSEQGTQGLIHAMLCALSAAGHDTHLLCYRDAAFALSAPYRVHRARLPLGAGGFRSGPSLRKLGLDLELAALLPRLVRALSPEVVVAHHVEAALSALAAAARPLWFVAHTSLRHELPSYFPPRLGGVCGQLGAGLDGFLCGRADRVWTVSPRLTEILDAASGSARPRTLVLPWSVPPPISAAERAEARASLGFASADEVVLYAGNFDAYQGLEPAAGGLSRLARLRPRLRWLIATAAAPRSAERLFTRHGLGARTRVIGLQGEPMRRLAHAACDLAIVPRKAEGGLPIKLLDALARGVPVVASRPACAGWGALTGVCGMVEEASAKAWAKALVRALDDGAGTRALAQEGRAYVQDRHAPARFAAQFGGA